MDGLHVNEARMGYDHVGAQDQANANMSIVGPGVYLDPFFGNKLAMEMTSANTLQIETGAVWANGHYVDLDHAVELQIANGKTANKRHDLVCIKCTISDLGGENQLDNYDLVVLQGEQTTGTPVDPEVPTDGLTDKVAESYAVIARVSLDGLTPTVEMLLHTIPSLMTPIESWQLAAGAVDNRALAEGSVSFEKITPFARAQIADRTISTLSSGGIENSVLRVNISNPDSPLNAPGRVIKDPSKNLNPTDLPSALASETIVYANRRVQWLDTGICSVWLFESYPKTRVWRNLYYPPAASSAGNSTGWVGWELVNWDSISQQSIPLTSVINMSDGYTLWTGGGGAFKLGKIISINFAFAASNKLTTTDTVVPGHIKAPYIPNNGAYIGNIDKRGIIEWDGEIRLQLDNEVPAGQRTWVRGLYLIG